MNKGTILVWTLALAAAGGGYMYRDRLQAEFAGLRPKPAAEHVEETKAPAISVVRVEPADFVETAMVSGSLVAREETLVSPEVEGFRVVELMVEEGDEVKKGQILARLVADQLEAQIAQNDANNARSDAAIARAKSQIVEAEARQKEAEAQLERAVPLKKSGYLSGAVFDQRESAALTSEAQVAATRDALKAAEADKAQVAAQRRELEWRRGNTEVKAPTNGIVSRRSARIGAMASAAGEPMFRIISNGEIELDAEVVETELSKVKAGQKAIVSVPGGTDVDGVVRLVAPEIDKTTRLGRVKILIGRNPSLHVGAFARGSIQTAASRGLAVPPGAVMFDPKGSFVQVVTNDRIVKREVTTGLVSGGLVEIKSGLAAGDLIVARAGTFLREGDVIHPITSEKRVSAATVEAK